MYVSTYGQGIKLGYLGPVNVFGETRTEIVVVLHVNGYRRIRAPRRRSTVLYDMKYLENNQYKGGGYLAHVGRS
jgi:hypothetical protein